MRMRALAALVLLAAGRALAEEPAFKEGDVLGFADVAKLEPFLPAEFWAHRELFFYEGMQLEIGPPQRDYSPAAAYVAATKEFAGKAKIGPDGSLAGYVAGQPFPMPKIDCARDPDAGNKIAWNFDYRWEGAGALGAFRLTYWDRGERLPLFLEGTVANFLLAHRVEPQYIATDRMILRGNLLKFATVVSVDAPFDARGRTIQTRRYVAADGPLATTRQDDVWTDPPTFRRLIHTRSAHRLDAVAGTDFTFENAGGFNGVVTRYRWECLGRKVLIAPMNTKVAGYPYTGTPATGPFGASFADDRWELRRSVAVRLVPKDAAHPVQHHDLYLDDETLTPLYGFVYGRDGRLWKIVWHDHRWSGDSLPQDDGPWYAGWPDVPEPRDLKVVGDVVVNVSTGSVTRVEFWKAHGTPLARGKLRRAIEFRRFPPD
jgi:hypothetical protein